MTHHRTSGLQRTLVSSTRLRLLQRLQQESPQTAPRLAESVQLHHNTVREHLERLIGDGLVVRASEHRTVRGRPLVLYSAAVGLAGANDSARAQTSSAIALGRAYRSSYPETAPAAPAAPAAPGWDGAAEAQLDVLEDHLDRSGFEPRVDRDALEIRLSCPFGALRTDLGASLCSVDRAVVCSVLARIDGPLEVSALTPADETGACVLRLSRRP